MPQWKSILEGAKKRLIVEGIIFSILFIIFLYFDAYDVRLNDYHDDCSTSPYMDETDTCKQQAQDLGVSGLNRNEVYDKIVQSSGRVNLATMGLIFIILFEVVFTRLYIRISKKLDEIKKPQPDVLSQSSGMTTTQITSIKEAKELLDKKIITNSEFEKIKNEYADEDVVTRLKGIAELRDSGGFTEREFLEQKSKILSETHSQTDEDLNSKNYNRYITGGGLVSRVSRRPVRALAIICAIILAILIFNDFSGDYETPQNVYLDMEICYDVVYNQTNYTYAYSYNYKKGNGDKNETNGTMTNQTGPMCILFTELVYLNGTMSFNAGSHCDYDCQGRVQIFTYGDNSGGIAVKGEREACEWHAGNMGLLHVSCRSSYAGTLEW